MDRIDRIPVATGGAGDEQSIVLPVAAARRVSNQIARAVRGTFGAETGLQTIVHATALQMLATGASRDAVSHAFAEYVRNHPACLSDDARPARSIMIIQLTRDCVERAAIELAKAS